MNNSDQQIDGMVSTIEYLEAENKMLIQSLKRHDSTLKNELIIFLKWVGDGYNFEENAEKIVDEYMNK